MTKPTFLPLANYREFPPEEMLRRASSFKNGITVFRETSKLRCGRLRRHPPHPLVAKQVAVQLDDGDFGCHDGSLAAAKRAMNQSESVSGK
jgi:hypothetical protein